MARGCGGDPADRRPGPAAAEPDGNPAEVGPGEEEAASERTQGFKVANGGPSHQSVLEGPSGTCPVPKSPWGILQLLRMSEALPWLPKALWVA